MVQGPPLADEPRRGGPPPPPQDRRLALSDFGGVRARFACRLFSDALHRSHFIPHADDCRTSRGLLWHLLLFVVRWIRRSRHSRSRPCCRRSPHSGILHGLQGTERRASRLVSDPQHGWATVWEHSSVAI